MFGGKGGRGGWNRIIRDLAGGIIAVILLIVFLKLFMVLVWMSGGFIVLLFLLWLAWKWFR
ncbi:hypothetical protein [Cohnella panacarvi]|uniref:hypothetical protein n=1 Tax=Cohnella panacarvi TaxID=400776 RepID=UPI000479BE36|nr:hypothetical protein [Cohnella panacarvi]